MLARFLLAASVCSACSLDGLADGGAGGQGGAPTTTTTVGGAGGDDGSPTGTGGAGGAPPVSRFAWIESIGNADTQQTSPFSTDLHGSSLRMSEPDAGGAVWLAAVTGSEIDPDGPGVGFEPMGLGGMRGLYLIELQPDGSVTAFHGYAGPPAIIENGLTVDSITRVGDGLAVAGSFRTGSIDFEIGVMTQNNTGADDGYLLVTDAAGQPTVARQITGISGDTQTARALTVRGNTIFVAGKLKQSWAAVDAATGAADLGCAFDDQAEVFDRAYVASFDRATLACDTLYTLTATDNAATQQALGVVADASGVYLAGSFTRQIIAAPLAMLPAISGEEGFVVALKPDLATGASWIARATSSQGGAADQLRSIALDGNRLLVGGFITAGTGTNTPSFGLAQGGNVCALDAPLAIDGFVGVLQKSNGDCLAAARLGEAGVDQVRAVVPDGQGAIAFGFTDGISGLDTTVAAPLSRNGFIARLDASLAPMGGVALGGTSLDYVDAVRAVEGGFVVAGSFGAAFDLLESQDDFFVGKLDLE